MKQWLSIILILVLAGCTQAPTNISQIEPQANYWQQLGSSVSTGAQASLAQTDAGIPVMAYSASDGISTNIYVKYWNGFNWVNVGSALSGSSATNSNASDPSLGLDSSGNPVVSWREYGSGFSYIYVKRWNGSFWENVGTGMLGGGSDPSLAMDSSGNLVIAYGNGGVYIKRFDGTTWVNVGSGVLYGVGSSVRYPSLVLDSSGNPVVAWSAYDGSTESLYIRRFDGTTWVNVGTGLLNGSSATNSYTLESALALDSSGNPVVAWVEENGLPIDFDFDIYVQRFDGSNWVNVGSGVLNSSSTLGSEFSPSLVLDSSGNPIVAWTEADTGTLSNSNVYIQQFNGNDWVDVGTTPLDTNVVNNAAYPSISIVNGSLVVAWQEGDLSGGSLYVKRFVTNAWQSLGGLLDVQGGQSAINSSIASKSNNLPVVAWDEDNGSSRNVYVKEWTGLAWSALGGAVDRTLANDAENPSIAMRSDNRPTVAWQEANNIYAKRWNGTIWTSIGAALDTVLANDTITPSLALDTTNLPVVAFAENGNILIKKSNGVVGSSSWLSPYGTTPLDTTLANEAYRPSLALKSDNNPIVAWYEDIGTSFNIYAKEWNGTSWIALGTTIDKTATRDAKDIVLAIRTDNRPVVAWEEAGNVYVKRWTGTSWVSVGGVLDEVSANEALRPALDLRTDNNPVVSWQEWNGSSYDVLAKRWTGTTWTFIGGELDKNPSRSARRPALVLKSDNNPIISWDEWDGTSENIYVRQF